MPAISPRADHIVTVWLISAICPVDLPRITILARVVPKLPNLLAPTDGTEYGRPELQRMMEVT